MVFWWLEDLGQDQEVLGTLASGQILGLDFHPLTSSYEEDLRLLGVFELTQLALGQSELSSGRCPPLLGPHLLHQYQVSWEVQCVEPVDCKVGEDTVYWEILLSCEQELGKDSDQDRRYVDMAVVGQDQA